MTNPADTPATDKTPSERQADWQELPQDAGGVPEAALELGKETLPRGARIAALSRDRGGVVWVEDAEGPRHIDRANVAPARALFAATKASAVKHRGNGNGNGSANGAGSAP